MGNLLSFGSKRKQLIILRGLPGSGKTTLAHTITKKNNGGSIISTDDFFMTNEGYIYDPKKLHEAVHSAISNAELAMVNQESLIIIDNVNSRLWEAKLYIQNAIKYGYEITIVEPDTEWKNDVHILYQKNQHNIPIKYINYLKNQWDNNYTTT